MKSELHIDKQWPDIRNHFNRCFRTNLHVSIASVSEGGRPTVTPIGSLFLNANRTGFYFEKYPKNLPEHAKANRRICVLAVNSGRWFWLKSLFKGKFATYPGIKLYGSLGERRHATEIEISRLRRRMKATNGMRGNGYLWGDMQVVRDITFEQAEIIRLGKMTAHLFIEQ